MNPTEEQKKKLWEWCGFRHIPAKYCNLCKRWEGEYWLKEGIGRRISRPELLGINLTDLFKYAVPKLDYAELTTDTVHKDMDDYAYAEVTLDGKSATSSNKDPALALFWAIYKVMEE